MKKSLLIILSFLILNLGCVYAGTDGVEKLTQKPTDIKANECFEKTSRAIFKFNKGLDNILFQPVAKGYRKIPSPIRKGTSNVVSNLRSLLTLSNNILQGDFRAAGNTTGRFLINSTVGILGIWDPASAFGVEKAGTEDFGQTLGVWGSNTGCYFVLPILGPTTTRDAVGLVGNVFLDPVYRVTHDKEMFSKSYDEHNYYYYRGTGAVDFRAKNIDSFESLERNSIDIYASVKSLYLQNRSQKILNSKSPVNTQDDSDWEEIDNK